MLRVVVPCVAVVAALVQAPGAAGAITLNPGADTVSTSRFELAFGPPNVERLDTLRWRDSGGNLSANLALNSGTGCSGGDPADQWGRADSIAGMPAPVGSGSAGTWAPRATRTVQVDSSRPTLCTGDTTVTPVRTRYTFFDSGAAASKVRVERRFSFSAATPDYQSASFRAYVPELPVNPYSQVIHPNQAGGALVTDQASNPPDTTSNWNGTWLALNDPVTGRGMLILRDPATPNPARIALESAGGANSSSVDLLKPAAGWKAPVTETEFLCFYDQTSWPPNQRSPSSLPAGCSVATVPVLNTPPGITGDPRAGTQLDGDAGSWDSAASFAYQWQRCSGGCTPIAGATGTSYTPTSDDEGKQLRLDVTATATGGESDAASSGLTDGVKPGPPSVPRNVGAPQVTGEARDGETLTGSNGNWAGGVTSFSYQWLRCATASGGNCVPVPGATSSTYKQVRDDVGSTVRLRVRATNGAGTSDPTDSAPTAIVQPQCSERRCRSAPTRPARVPTTFDGSGSRTPNGPIVRYRYTYQGAVRPGLPGGPVRPGLRRQLPRPTAQHRARGLRQSGAGCDVQLEPPADGGRELRPQGRLRARPHRGDPDGDRCVGRDRDHRRPRRLHPGILPTSRARTARSPRRSASSRSPRSRAWSSAAARQRRSFPVPPATPAPEG